MGCMVGIFHHCNSCKKGQEQYYEEVIWTYGSTDVDGSITIDQEAKILQGSTEQQIELFRIYLSNKAYNVWFQFLS